MVNDIRLYIDKEQVEFKTVPDIYYNWCETDFSNPIVTKNSYSKTITISGTKNNNKIFGHFWNLERYQEYTISNNNNNNNNNNGIDFNPSKKVPFSIYVDGSLFEKGYVKLQRVYKVNNEYQYEIGLFGGLGSFFYNLSVNKEDGSLKTFKDLNYYIPSINAKAELSFFINKDTVYSAWENINSNYNTYGIINFMPAYVGIPDKFDSNKVLMEFPIGESGNYLPDVIEEDGITYLPERQEYAIGELSSNIDMWQAKDLRSYLQVPVLRVKSIFDALQKRENTRGEYDDGYELVLDNEFFNSNNPYYQDSYVTLPKINTLTFNEEDYISEITGFSFYISYTGDTEETSLTFELPEEITDTNKTVRVTFDLYNKVTLGSYYEDNDKIPVALYMQNVNLDDSLVHRTALGAQLIALSSSDSILTGSTVNWYTSNDFTNTPFTFREAINNRRYIPKFFNNYNDVKTYNKDCYFDFKYKSEGKYFYRFRENRKPIELELIGLPVGTKKIELNIQRVSQTAGEAGYNLYYSSNPSAQYICKGYYDNSSYNTSYYSNGKLILSNYNVQNFFSNKYISQDNLLNVDYSVSEWLISYCKMFGLYIHKDVLEDKIYITTRNNYYFKNNIEDISKLIDYSKEFSINPIYMSNKFYSLTSPIEKNKYSETYLHNHNNQYGMKLINTGYDFETKPKELLDKFKIKTAIPVNRQDLYNFLPKDGINPYVYNGFKYKLYKDGDSENEETYEVEINKEDIVKKFEGYFFNNKYPFYDNCYKMCFENGGKEINTSGVMVFYNGNKQLETPYLLSDDIPYMQQLNNNPCWVMSNNSGNYYRRIMSIPIFSSYYAPNKTIDFSSNFGSPRELFVREDELQNDDRATLYHQFYSRYYEDLFDVNTKVIDCWIKPKYILNGDSLRKLFWFDNSIWRLNKVVDYSPVENRTVKCQFIKIQDINNLSNEIPQNGVFIVTVNKSEISYTGETITGKVTSRYEWEYVTAYERINNTYIMIPVIVTPNSDSSGRNISITLPANNDTSSRTIEIFFRSGDRETYVAVYQEGKPEENYFKWNATDSSNYTTPILDSTATTFTATFRTNISYTELSFVPQQQGVNVTKYRSYITVDFSGGSDSAYTINVLYNSNTIGYLVIRKDVPQDYFKWTATQSNYYTQTVSSALTSFTVQFDSSYTDLSFVGQELGVEVSRIGNTYVRVDFPSSFSEGTHSYTVNVYNNSVRVGQLKIFQIFPAFYEWTDNRTSAITVSNVAADTTFVTKGCRTNYSSLTFNFDGTVVTGASISASYDYMTALLSVNTTTSSRNGYLDILKDGVVCGRMDITQN